MQIADRSSLVFFRRQSGSDECQARLSGRVGGRRWVLVPFLGVAVVSLVVSSSFALRSLTTSAGAAGSPCQFQKADQPLNVALCETFDQPAGTGNRSGDLNGTLWGVSRNLGPTNFGQGQFSDVVPTPMDKCGQNVIVQPPNDVAICNGQLVEAQTDQGGVTSLAMYPKQPFDIAGRTGTIAFDVSDDTHGTHRAWPEIWYTDQPVPTPFAKGSATQAVPKNGFGIRFAGTCPVGGSCDHSLCPNVPLTSPTVTVSSAGGVNNYVSDDSDTNDNPPANNPIHAQIVGCVKQSSGPGDMNHFEIRVSQNEIDVYGTDAGATTGPMTKLAIFTNFSLSLTRGLVWMEDVHYNGDKDGTDQGTHTFTWDNFGFDGPTVARDLAFDVLDRLTPTGGTYQGRGLLKLGWVAPSSGTPLTVTAPGVYNIANATGALLTFEYAMNVPVTVSYSLNGHAWHDIPWPFGTVSTVETIGVRVDLTEIQPGANTIQFKSTDATAISNIDLVLQNAARHANGSSPGSGSPVAGAAFTAPRVGAVDVKATVPVSWTAAPTARGYYLTVGTSPGGYDVVNTGRLARGVTSYRMPILPVGRFLYARLYSESSGGYVDSSDVTFRAAPGAEFTYPVDEQVNVDTTRRFSWTKAPNAQGYYVTVGTTQGGFDLLNSGTLPGGATSTFAGAALPTNRSLYARVYTKVDVVFVCFHDITFTAHPGLAVLTKPIDGAVGGTDPGSFVWTAVGGALGYVLTIGTAPGEADVVNSGPLSSATTSYTARRALPKHKRLYASIYTELNEGHVRVANISYTT